MKNRIWTFGKVELGLEPRALSLADIRRTTEVCSQPAPSILGTTANWAKDKCFGVPPKRHLKYGRIFDALNSFPQEPVANFTGSASFTCLHHQTAFEP